jgi:hypothetical protein
MMTDPGCGRFFCDEGADVAADAEPVIDEAPGGSASRARPVKAGHLDVAELVSDRAAAPSPFGDDQTFPLPVDELTYKPTIRS